MGAAFDALNMQQSLGPRRQVSASLPSFELPNPHIQQPLPKHQIHPIGTSQPSSSGVKVGNLLTPPAHSASESSGTLSPGVAGSGQVQPYPQAYWQTPSYSYPARSTSHSSAMPDSLAPSYGQNSVYPSPLSPSPALSATSTQHPHGDQQQPQPQSNQHSSQQQHSASSHQQPISQTHSNTPTQPSQPPHPANSLDPYGQKYAYGGPQASPTTPTSYQPYPSASTQVPSTSGTPSSRVPGMPMAYPLDNQQALPQFTRPYPSYSLPAMNGPIMSNIHSPNNQMALIGSMQPNMMPGYHSGHAASLHMYNGHPHAHPQMHLVQPQQSDRPFRCDLCPQSFNRNHDLKRHKRIHLAVKPFPCGHCDKSFSRKDALKRHILVKGCGRDPSDPASTSAPVTSASLKAEPIGSTMSPLLSTTRLDK